VRSLVGGRRRGQAPPAHVPHPRLDSVLILR